MGNFKKLAEEWAQKELDKHNIEDLTENITEMLIYGSFGYTTDKDGNRRKLSREELWGIRTEEIFRGKRNKDR